MSVPNNITMTIELCAEDRARLDNILAALAGSHTCKCAGSPAPVEVVAPVTEAVPAVEVYTPEAESPAEAKYTPSFDELQRKVLALIAAGKKPEVREIVKSYATKVSDIPEDKLAEAWERLTGLEV